VNKQEFVAKLLGDRLYNKVGTYGKAFAPSNIALCKYWGKRNNELNLPVTDSLSISLGNKGTTTEISLCSDRDQFIVNGKKMSDYSSFYNRAVNFLDLFRVSDIRFKINSETNLPIGAGLASSACGFASLVKSLNELFSWNADLRTLSLLARLGSGSACRSLSTGFVHWQAGVDENGLDSFAIPIKDAWPELCIGVLLLKTTEKNISSREAMRISVNTSPFYDLWPREVSQAITVIKSAIMSKNFNLLASTAEKNSLSMHALMLSSQPSIIYTEPQTLGIMQQIWEVRKQGIEIYFTQDAGPNLKLLLLERDIENVKKKFPSVDIVKPFITEGVYA
jgi:diphosphomevalonate decarboxylase